MADLNQRLIEAGAVFVDSPVLGSSKPAELGTLLIMPSGPEDAVEKLTPLFMAMGERIVNCGQPPQASMMKLTVNLVQIAMMEGLAEGVHFARKGGLDLATLFEILLKGTVGNSLYELKARKHLSQISHPSRPCSRHTSPPGTACVWLPPGPVS
jgi:3-hydroxyisobutyrate dehydrogenase